MMRLTLEIEIETLYSVSLSDLFLLPELDLDNVCRDFMAAESMDLIPFIQVLVNIFHLLLRYLVLHLLNQTF